MTVSLQRLITESVRPPRALFLHWPLGHPFGEPDHVAQQRAVCQAALELATTVTEPGTIVAPGWRWRRETYAPGPVDPAGDTSPGDTPAGRAPG